ncbi:hypothetical protein D9757_005917 [Collybiopsis confluens]|uniref:Peptidase A1 domain-containing protein n=1 Tax=Collybiopsis confluens TaxID=2823264 RepID=A0A8H5HN43_9AGAR|nr:hypothetical protein D9757_005917 [Collybiopsis confluens]
MSWPAIFFFLSPSIAVLTTRGSYLSQRSPSNAPGTLYVPINFDKSQRQYTVNVTLPNGSTQDLLPYRFGLTTSTGYSFVVGPECSVCGSNPTFSVPSQPGPSQNISLPKGYIIGSPISQKVGLQLQNGSSWSWPDPAFLVVNQSSPSIFSSDFSGIIGLGQFNTTPMGSWLMTNPSQQNFSFGLALNPADDVALSDGGVLHWIAPDKDAYQGDIAWKTLISSSSLSSSNGSSILSEVDSFVEMDSWTFHSATGLNISPSAGNLLTAVDPFSMDIVFPQSETRSIYDAVPGSSRQAPSGPSAAYELPCDAKLSLTLTFGGISTTLTESQLVYNLENSTCIGVLQEWANDNETGFLLGSSFISNIYLIFQGSGSGSSFGFAHRKALAPPLNGAAIAGVVLGSLAFLIATVTAAAFFLRRRQHNRIKVEPFMGVVKNPFDDSKSVSHPSRTGDSGRVPADPVPLSLQQQQHVDHSYIDHDWLPHFVLAPTGLVPVQSGNIGPGPIIGNDPGRDENSQRQQHWQIPIINTLSPSIWSRSPLSPMLYSPVSCVERRTRADDPVSDPTLFLRVSLSSAIGLNNVTGRDGLAPEGGGGGEEGESRPLLRVQGDTHLTGSSSQNNSVSSLPAYSQSDPALLLNEEVQNVHY